MRPALNFQGEPDRIARTRALFSRVPLELTWRERWALRWRIWVGDGLGMLLLPVVAAALLSLVALIWWLERDA